MNDTCWQLRAGRPFGRGGAQRLPIVRRSSAHSPKLPLDIPAHPEAPQVLKRDGLALADHLHGHEMRGRTGVDSGLWPMARQHAPPRPAVHCKPTARNEAPLCTSPGRGQSYQSPAKYVSLSSASVPASCTTMRGHERSTVASRGSRPAEQASKPTTCLQLEEEVGQGIDEAVRGPSWECDGFVQRAQGLGEQLQAAVVWMERRGMGMNLTSTLHAMRRSRLAT